MNHMQASSQDVQKGGFVGPSGAEGWVQEEEKELSLSLPCIINVLPVRLMKTRESAIHAIHVAL